MSDFESKNYIMIYPKEYFAVDTIEGRLGLLGLLEEHHNNGLEYVTMLPNGLMLFRKTQRFVTPQCPHDPDLPTENLRHPEESPAPIRR